MAKISITLPDKDLKEIREYCKKTDLKISQIFRKGVKKILQEEQNDHSRD